MSPSRIHVRFFIEPGIRPIRKIPSMHRNRTRFAPSMVSTVASTSLFSLRGVRTRVICGAACLSFLLFFLYRLIPHSFVCFISNMSAWYVSYVVKGCVCFGACTLFCYVLVDFSVLFLIAPHRDCRKSGEIKTFYII